MITRLLIRTRTNKRSIEDEEGGDQEENNPLHFLTEHKDGGGDHRYTGHDIDAVQTAAAKTQSLIGFRHKTNGDSGCSDSKNIGRVDPMCEI